MFRNREIRRFSLLFAGITFTAAAGGFALHPAAGLMAFFCAAAFGTAFFAFTRARYRRLAELAGQIDIVLHYADRLCIREAEEGELSILQTEIAKMTQRIREQNDALKKDREHLADSLADIAHQLRTPLTSISLILTLLENTPDERGRAGLLREAEELLARMDWLITSLLKLSRLDAGIVSFAREPVNVKELIDAALRPLAIPLELRGVSLRLNVPEKIRITGDRLWLSEALQNILKNCMESAGHGGWIAIACRDTPLFTEITLRDSGPGFSDADLPHVFDRFYRGNPGGTAGYGIGLALCRMILTRQGGTVSAKNHPEGGALFTIRFPK